MKHKSKGWAASDERTEFRRYIVRPKVSGEKIGDPKTDLLNSKLNELIARQQKKFSIDRQKIIDKMLGKPVPLTKKQKRSAESWRKNTKKHSGPAPSPVRHRYDLVDAQNFYRSREWLNLRFAVLAKYGRECMCCGVMAKPAHVDHIKPRIKYPELALDFNNLQVLCEACNKGKDWKFETDFRAKEANDGMEPLPGTGEQVQGD